MRAETDERNKGEMVETELRIYKVKAGSLNRFVDAWRSEVLPLREKFGFTVVGAWRTVDESEFTWQLTYGGPQSLREREQEYAEARARHRFDDDPAAYLDEVTVRFLVPIEVGGSCRQSSRDG